MGNCFKPTAVESQHYAHVWAEAIANRADQSVLRRMFAAEWQILCVKFDERRSLPGHHFNPTQNIVRFMDDEVLKMRHDMMIEVYAADSGFGANKRCRDNITNYLRNNT